MTPLIFLDFCFTQQGSWRFVGLSNTRVLIPMDNIQPPHTRRQ